MPLNAVKYEDLWNRAKKIVDKQYPDVPRGSDRYWSLVMALYKQFEKKRDWHD